MNTQQVNTLPAGNYIISDPYFIMHTKSQEDWTDFLARHNNFDQDGVYEENGIKFGMMKLPSTGNYTDEVGRNYAVYSGYLAIVPEDVAELTSTIEVFLNKFLHQVTLSEPSNPQAIISSQ